MNDKLQDAMPMVEILLSTYNGEKYLCEQLDSLLYQTYQNIVITVRDDQSNDSTQLILARYKENYPTKITIIPSDINLGSTMSFYTLLLNSSSPYVMFCDQDDVWYLDKVETSLDLMVKNETQDPCMVFTDLEVVDRNCKQISPSLLKRMKIEPSLLVKDVEKMVALNPVAGCTTLLNRAAASKILKIGLFPQEVIHDHWMAIIVKMFGNVLYLDRPTLKYRQHGFNQVGDLNVDKKYLFGRILNIKKTIKHDYIIFDKLRKHGKLSLSSIVFSKVYFNLIRFFK